MSEYRPDRRTLLAALLSLLLPGLGQAVVQRRRDFWILPGLFVGGGLVAVAYAKSLSTREVVQFMFSPSRLLLLATALVLAGVLHAWSVVTTIERRDGRARRGLSMVIVVTLAMTSVVVWSWGASIALSQRTMVLEVFSQPTHEAQSGYTGDSQPTYKSGSAVPVSLHRGEFTILLLGGDAGKGRWSRRTDTIIAVRANLDTGAVAFVSVPRNLTRLRFPEGSKLAEEYPKGFPDLANALYVRVSAKPQLVPGSYQEPGLEALKIGVSELLGWDIQNYLLVDMEGFVNMVDALGGVTLRSTSDVLPTGRLPGSSYQAGSFHKGELLHMDGEEALAYARSRTGSSDYARMRRQRCVVSALFKQTGSATLLRNLTSLQDIARKNVLTDVPVQRVPGLIDVLSSLQASHAKSLLLIPPTIQPSRWDPAEVRTLADSVWESAVSAAAPHPAPAAASGTSGAPSGTTDVSRVTPSTSSTTTTASPTEDLGEACAE